MLIDTHAHIHFEDFQNTIRNILDNANISNVGKIITVGTNDEDSRKAVKFTLDQPINSDVKIFSSVGVHPHDAHLAEDGLIGIKELLNNIEYENIIVAIGECGLDYAKNLSSKFEQRRMLEWQLDLSQEYNLPVIFHVRDAWEDFFDIIKKYRNLTGVIHSFTGGKNELNRALDYNLFFGLNGIVTFTKNDDQLNAVKKMPLSKMVLETDCPFLSPVPMRGKVNEPSYLKYTAEFIAKLRNVNFEELENITTKNAEELFKI